MSLITDIQFVPRLSPYVQGLKHLGEYAWACRCPYCGDSKKNKHKKRGSIYRKGDSILYNCFNCGVGTNLGHLIEHCSPDLYKEYKLEWIKENAPGRYEKQMEAQFHEVVNSQSQEINWEDDHLASLKRLDKMSESHPAVQYVLKRDISKELLTLFYFSPKFKTYANSLIPGKFNEESLKNDYPRLVIPCFDRHGKMYAFSGRAFGDEQPKYLHIKLDTTKDMIFGMERLDFSKHIIVVEGQIDSIFLPNCIAVAGSSFDVEFVQKVKTNCTLVLDNEPRNKQIVDKYKKYIQCGYRVCMMPESYTHKDINEAIQAGESVDNLVKLIHDHSYSGLMAMARFATWKKT